MAYWLCGRTAVDHQGDEQAAVAIDLQSLLDQSGGGRRCAQWPAGFSGRAQHCIPEAARHGCSHAERRDGPERKGGVVGKRVSVRVDYGGRRIIKTKHRLYTKQGNDLQVNMIEYNTHIKTKD